MEHSCFYYRHLYSFSSPFPSLTVYRLYLVGTSGDTAHLRRLTPLAPSPDLPTCLPTLLAHERYGPDLGPPLSLRLYSGWNPFIFISRLA